MKITTILQFVLSAIFVAGIHTNSTAQYVELKALEAVLNNNQALLKRYMINLEEKTDEYRYYKPIIDLGDEGEYIYVFEDERATFIRSYDEKVYKQWVKNLKKEFKYSHANDRLDHTEYHGYIINDRSVVIYRISEPNNSYLMISYEFLNQD